MTLLSNGSRLYLTENLTGSGTPADYVEIAEVAEFPEIPNEASVVDVTRVKDKRVREIAGRIENSDYTFSGFWDPTDPGFIKLSEIRESGAIARFEVDSDGSDKTLVFTAIVRGLSKGGMAQNSAQSFTCNLSIRSVEDDISTPSRTGIRSSDNPTGASGRSGRSGASGGSAPESSS